MVSTSQPRRGSSEEYPLDAVADRDTIVVVADRLAAFGGAARAAIDRAAELGDRDTADLFTEVSRAIDKHLWFVGAHLLTQPRPIARSQAAGPEHR